MEVIAWASGIVFIILALVGIIVVLSKKAEKNKYNDLIPVAKKRKKIAEIEATHYTRAESLAVLKRLRKQRSDKERDPSVPRDSK